MSSADDAGAAPGGPTPAAPPPTWRGAWILLIGSLVFGLVTDLISKWAAFRYIADVPAIVRRPDVIASNRLGELLPLHDPVVVVPSVLNLTLVLNPGAVFGIGAGQRWLFIAFTLLAIVFSMWIFLRWTTPRDRSAHAAIGLLLSGGIGNLYDRLVYACVRDFLHPLPGVQLPWGLTWPNGSRDIWPYVSNIADLWLIIGIAVLLVYSWRKPDAGHHTTPAAPPDPNDQT
jgi:signal peptidase II